MGTCVGGNPYRLRVKECPKCRTVKPLSAYSSNVGRRDGVQSYCAPCQREYQKEHYRRNAERYRASAAVRNEQRRAKVRRIIRKAKDRPCADCGRRYPVFVMDFDHRSGTRKLFNIGAVALAGRYDEPSLGEEIRKCDVVCANCHRMRTHRPSDRELGRQDSNLD